MPSPRPPSGSSTWCRPTAANTRWWPTTSRLPARPGADYKLSLKDGRIAILFPRRRQWMTAELPENGRQGVSGRQGSRSVNLNQNNPDDPRRRWCDQAVADYSAQQSWIILVHPQIRRGRARSKPGRSVQGRPRRPDRVQRSQAVAGQPRADSENPGAQRRR